MPEIDPNAPPVPAADLERDAAATGADRDAPPLTEAGKSDNAAADRIEADLTLLPPG